MLRSSSANSTADNRRDFNAGSSRSIIAANSRSSSTRNNGRTHVSHVITNAEKYIPPLST